MADRPWYGTTLDVETSATKSVIDLRSSDGSSRLLMEVGESPQLRLRAEVAGEIVASQAELRAVKDALEALVLAGSAVDRSTGASPSPPEKSEPAGYAEHHPGHSWAIRVGDIAVGSVEIGGHEAHFKWSSGTVAWPPSFKVDPPLHGKGLPVSQRSFPLHRVDVSSYDYEIVVGGEVLGWLKVDGPNTEWYALPEHVQEGYVRFGRDGLQFRANTKAGLVTCYKVVDESL